MPMAAQLPERLGPYRLLQSLGTGAMGEVFLAEEEGEDRLIALKVLHAHLLTRRNFFERFQREAIAGESVQHPNVVRAYDSGFQLHEGTPLCVLAMEYVEGRTLRDLLQDWGTVPEALVREIAQQVAAGLAAIHEAGLIHRDLKPENVLITDDHRIRILDLGIARHTEAATALTQDGQFAGSLPYAAPEQFEGGTAVGPAVDLYALGVVLYELTSGVNPFRHDELAPVLKAHADLVPERLDRRTEETSAFLAEVVATLLAKDPDDRFESAATLSRVLAEGVGSDWWKSREREVLEEGQRRVRVPVRRETRLYGREDDLTLLAKAWGRARTGNGNTVLLEGEAGIGKSRVVDAFLEGIDGQQAQVLYGSCARSERNGGISDAILGRFGREDLESSLQPYLGATPTLVPALAALLRREPLREDAPVLQGDPLQAVFVHLMRALADERALVWVVEDLHYADAYTRQLVLSLSRAVEGHPVLLLLTSRPTLAAEDLAKFSRLENLGRRTLSRLGARQVIELLQDAFKSERLAEKLGGTIALKSDGVPFFVFEMIRGLQEGQFITKLPDGSWVESEVIEDIEVPDTVRELIEARLRGLADDERAILDVGAVQGFEFDPVLVARALNRPPVHVLQSVAAMERRSGVVCAHGRDVRFDHHQIQEVLYESLMPALGEAYHAALADALEAREGTLGQDPEEVDGATCVMLCEHFLRGRQGKRALRYLDPALGHLRTGYHNEQAITLARRALEVDGLLGGEVRLDVLLGQFDRLHVLGRRAEQEALLVEARALAEERGERRALARVENRAGVLLNHTHRYQEAKEHFERELAIAREIGDRMAEGGATLSLGQMSHNVGRNEEARAYIEEALAIAREIGDRGKEGSSIQGLGVMCKFLGRSAEARAYHEQDLAIAREIGNRWGEGVAALNLGAMFQDLGLIEESRTHVEQALAIARETGNRGVEGMATGNLGTLSRFLGRYEEARAYFEQALAIAREVGRRRSESMATDNLGSVCLLLGRYDEARAYYEQALAIAREIGDLRGECYATGSLGLVCWQLGRYEEARAYQEQTLAIAREIESRSGEAIALVNLGPIWRELGDWPRARSALEQSLTICREIGARYPEGYALLGLASLACADPEPANALDLAMQALTLRREIGHRDGVCDSLIQLGELHLRTGAVDAAQQHLLEAADLLRAEAPKHLLPQAHCLLANLPDGDTAAAEESLREAGEAGNTPKARYYLWKATGKPEHLAEAKRLLDYRVEHAPEEYRESMLKNVRLNREIESAWKALHSEQAPRVEGLDEREDGAD